jgi:hypothetical protein
MTLEEKKDKRRSSGKRYLKSKVVAVRFVKQQNRVVNEIGIPIIAMKPDQCVEFFVINAICYWVPQKIAYPF